MNSSVRLQDLMGVVKGARLVIDSMRVGATAASNVARNFEQEIPIVHSMNQSQLQDFDLASKAREESPTIPLQMDSSETIDFVNLSSRNFMATHQPLSEFTSHYQAIRATSPSTTLPTSSHHSTHTQTHHVLVPTPTPLELAVHPTVIPDISTSSLVNKVHLPHIPTPLQDDQNQQPAQIQQPTQIQQLIQQEKEEQERLRQLNTDKMNQLLQQQEALRRNAKERKVPTSRASRLWHIGELAVGMGVGALGEITRRTLGVTDQPSTNPLLTEANAERITSTLCRMRGAALKLGQMLSIQDNQLIPKELAQILDRVRHSADRMTTKQLEFMLVTELGENWISKLSDFDRVALAAASIGQVHKARTLDNREIAMKIQYPGVAESIPSDIANLSRFIRVMGFIPQSMFRDLDSAIEVARTELMWETDYKREAKNQMRFRELLKGDKDFHVPEVLEELSTARILTSEFARGVPIEKIVEFDQDTRNKVALRILRLCLQELFQYRFMQTDSNWSNFFYDPLDDKITLLDFGACREFDKRFTDEYLKVIYSASNKDREGVLRGSKELGFLTGEENRTMNDAHVDAAMVVGEPFSTGTFNFASQKVTQRVHELVPTMLKHRLTAPPSESYSLHRKLSGAFLLCTKLGAQIDCRKTFLDVYSNYKFG